MKLGYPEHTGIVAVPNAQTNDRGRVLFRKLSHAFEDIGHGSFPIPIERNTNRLDSNTHRFRPHRTRQVFAQLPQYIRQIIRLNRVRVVRGFDGPVWTTDC